MLIYRVDKDIRVFIFQTEEPKNIKDIQNIREPKNKCAKIYKVKRINSTVMSGRYPPA